MRRLKIMPDVLAIYAGVGVGIIPAVWTGAILMHLSPDGECVAVGYNPCAWHTNTWWNFPWTITSILIAFAIIAGCGVAGYRYLGNGK